MRLFRAEISTLNVLGLFLLLTVVNCTEESKMQTCVLLICSSFQIGYLTVSCFGENCALVHKIQKQAANTVLHNVAFECCGKQKPTERTDLKSKQVVKRTKKQNTEVQKHSYTWDIVVVLRPICFSPVQYLAINLILIPGFTFVRGAVGKQITSML